MNVKEKLIRANNSRIQWICNDGHGIVGTAP